MCCLVMWWTTEKYRKKRSKRQRGVTFSPQKYCAETDCCLTRNKTKVIKKKLHMLMVFILTYLLLTQPLPRCLWYNFWRLFQKYSIASFNTAHIPKLEAKGSYKNHKCKHPYQNILWFKTSLFNNVAKWKYNIIMINNFSNIQTNCKGNVVTIPSNPGNPPQTRDLFTS